MIIKSLNALLRLAGIVSPSFLLHQEQIMYAPIIGSWPVSAINLWFVDRNLFLILLCFTFEEAKVVACDSIESAFISSK